MTKLLTSSKVPSVIAGMWAFAPTWGAANTNKSTFSDWADPGFPETTANFKAIKSIKIWSDGDLENPMFRGWDTTYSLADGRVETISNPSISDRTKADEMVLSEDDPVNYISLARRRLPGGGDYYISCVEMYRRGQVVAVGKIHDTWETWKFGIPKGWRFAGFHGNGGNSWVYV